MLSFAYYAHMKLEKLKITNFRNLEDAVIEFSPKTTILVGKNAQGKTNILEAIHLLALSKSFRSSKTLDLIKWESNFLRVSGNFNADESDEEIESMDVFFERQPNKRSRLSINKSEFKAKDYVGRFTAVTFIPDDVLLLTGSPSYRRKYLDILISQISREYLYALSDYGKTIKERNALLGMIAMGKSQKNELKFWNERLVKYGELIIKKRKEILKKIGNKLTKIIKNISNVEIDIKIKYKPSINDEDRFEEIIYAEENGDILYKTTRKGPHRDDFEIMAEGRNLGEYGSRGEIRSALLALKICELEIIQEINGKKPILLLDDVFSELDSFRQKALLEVINSYQSIITTTDQFKEKVDFYYQIETGRVVR